MRPGSVTKNITTMNLNQTFSITFWLNKAKTNKQGLTPIWLRITVNSKRAECSVQKFVHLKHWDTDNNRVRSGCSDANSINDYLDLVRSEVLRHYNILLTTRDVVTADDVKNSYKGVKEIK